MVFARCMTTGRAAVLWGRALALVGLFVLAPSLAACADEWVAAPSTYTHDPRTGERVNQYSPIGPVYWYPRRTQSGYRHIQSVIRAGDSADYLHIVEEWGDRPVRPYGEWQYPFRPYSVPYQLWGPPPPIVAPLPWPYGY